MTTISHAPLGSPVRWARRALVQELLSARTVRSQCRTAAELSRYYPAALADLAAAHLAAVRALTRAIQQLPQTETPYV